MSFNATVRDELAHVMDESPTARKAELAALARLGASVGGSAGGHFRIELSTENAAVARKVIQLARECYGLTTEVVVRKSIMHGANNYLVTVPAQKALNAALDEFGLIGGHKPRFDIAPELVQGDADAAAYLRGAFLASGFIADPKGDFHFEISMHNESLARAIKGLMARFDIEAKVTTRRNAWTVYLKGAEPIIDFLALVGAHRSLLHAEDIRVYKSIRNTTNRQVNAEIANQAKATEAALRQIELIERIEAQLGLDALPAALKEFAQLRREHPEASLRQLGALFSPPLTKSAMNHRVRRIEEIAAGLVDEGKVGERSNLS